MHYRPVRTAVLTLLLAFCALLYSTGQAQRTPEPRVQVFTSKLPFGETFVHSFVAAEGDTITITARSLDGDFDPRITVSTEDGLFLEANDNAEIPDPALRVTDARIQGFVAPYTGDYVIEVSALLGLGGSMELTLTWSVDQMFLLQREETIAYSLREPISSELMVQQIGQYDRYLYTFDGRRGDVYTFYARALSGDLDPRLSIYLYDTLLVDANDDHGSSDSSLGESDARLMNVILPDDGQYFVEVRGYGGTSGNAAFSVVHVARGALAYPGTDQVFEGEVARGEFDEYHIEARVGDYISLTAHAVSSLLDPYVSLRNPAGELVIDNDNHGFNDADIDFFDARVKNFLVMESGVYTVGVGSVRGGEGAYVLTVNIKRDRRLYSEYYEPPTTP